MNSPSTSVVVAGAVRSAAQLVVMLFVVVRAHVKDGVQTACRHNLIFAHFRCIILQDSIANHLGTTSATATSYESYVEMIHTFCQMIDHANRKAVHKKNQRKALQTEYQQSGHGHGRGRGRGRDEKEDGRTGGCNSGRGRQGGRGRSGG